MPGAKSRRLNAHWGVNRSLASCRSDATLVSASAKIAEARFGSVPRKSVRIPGFRLNFRLAHHTAGTRNQRLQGSSTSELGREQIQEDSLQAHDFPAWSPYSQPEGSPMSPRINLTKSTK